jgi:DNA-binding PucR family transcriptional regulator
VKPIACLAVLADLQSRALDYATTVESYLNNNINAVLADLQSRALDYATTVESYLNNNSNVFPTVDSDNEKLDGCYLTLNGETSFARGLQSRD